MAGGIEWHAQQRAAALAPQGQVQRQPGAGCHTGLPGGLHRQERGADAAGALSLRPSLWQLVRWRRNLVQSLLAKPNLHAGPSNRLHSTVGSTCLLGW